MGKLLIFDYSSCVKTRVYRDLPCIVLPLREGAGVKVRAGAVVGLVIGFLKAKGNRESKNGHYFLDHFWVNRRYLG